MKKLTPKEIKNIELEILIAFDKFCKEHKIKYSLGAGTLIGAIRHKGFIPWDDDIDIFMVREEYNRFVDLIMNGEKVDVFKVYLPTDSEAVFPFIKIVNPNTIVYPQNRLKKYASGLWMDIFPVDCCGNSENEILKNVRFLKSNMTKLERSTMHYTNKNIVNRMKNMYLLIAQKIFHYRYWIFKKRIIEYPLPEQGKYWGTIRWPYYKGNGLCDVYPKEYFEGYTEKEFEGQKFMVFQYYDQILSHRYGDYMKLPDEKDRVSHGMDAYLIEEEVR